VPSSVPESAIDARLIGFGVGIALMVLVPWLNGTPVGYL